ncbi:tRNA lysidine(34) synthetase TilS [Chryseobacterium sp. MYb7]|uniref:tRNA lysidine(34) synthetase TilS n=1 Tax=Chryseobacterium sp. MYb7 TaxID=1827290 RepID=UPI000F4FE1CC
MYLQNIFLSEIHIVLITQSVRFFYRALFIFVLKQIINKLKIPILNRDRIPLLWRGGKNSKNF